MRKHIVSDPNILSGKPVIAGTRIPIVQILFLLKTGYTLQGIQEEYPNVKLSTLQRVLNELASDISIARHDSQNL